MPSYGYRCKSCGHEFEVLQKMSDAPLQTCPKCAGQLAKKIYAAGIVYKGSGYYTTDYKGSGKASEKAASNGAGDSQPAEAKSDAKSESKSESSSDASPAKESKGSDTRSRE